ncbi:MAG: LCP family protein [Ilumatobacter sp.]|nr:LCP family protein [Ilumatobacter sp.]
MFDHLDDPTPPELGDRFHDRVVGAAQRRQRRARVMFGSVALLPLLIVGGLALYLRDQAGELRRVEVAGLAPADTSPATTTPPAGSETTAATVDASGAVVEDVPPIATPLNILVVGVDRRPPGSEVTGSRADTIAVVRIDPDRGRVGVLSLPRDLWVEHEGIGRRLNAFTEDPGLVEVVSSLLAVDIHHYVEVDFEGFESLIDLAGGVSVPFDTAVRDSQTGFTAAPGCNELSGSDALAYARSRRLESLDATTGRWSPDPTSDLGRVARQQDLTQRIYRDVLSANYSTTDEVRLLTNVVDDITVDTGLDLDGLRAILNAAQLIGPEHVQFYDLNAGLTSETIQGNSVLIVDDATTRASVDGLLGNAPPEAANQPPTTLPGAINPPAEPC